MSKSNYDHTDEILLKDIILKLKLFKEELYNKRMFVFMVTSIFILFGIVYYSVKEPIYHSNLTFVVENGSSSAGGLAKYSGLASQFGFDLGGGMSSTFTETNIIEILQSRKVVEEALLYNHALLKALETSSHGFVLFIGYTKPRVIPNFMIQGGDPYF